MLVCVDVTDGQVALPQELRLWFRTPALSPATVAAGSIVSAGAAFCRDGTMSGDAMA